MNKKIMFFCKLDTFFARYFLYWKWNSHGAMVYRLSAPQNLGNMAKGWISRCVPIRGLEMFVFQKIWRALSSCFLRFEIPPFTLLPTKKSFLTESELIFCAASNPVAKCRKFLMMRNSGNGFNKRSWQNSQIIYKALTLVWFLQQNK